MEDKSRVNKYERIKYLHCTEEKKREKEVFEDSVAYDMWHQVVHTAQHSTG